MPKPATNRRSNARLRSLRRACSARPRSYGIGAIADGGDDGEDFAQARAARVPAHARPVRGEIDVDAEHAGQPHHALLDQPDARRAADALEHQRVFACSRGICRRGAGGGQIVGGEIAQRLRHRVVARRQGAALAVVRQQAVIGDRLRHRGATRAAHRLRCAVDERALGRARRHRQPAMKTGRTCVRPALRNHCGISCEIHAGARLCTGPAGPFCAV